MTEREKILRRLAKLLTLAEDQGETPEGQLAAMRARTLMAKYCVTEGEVPREDEVVERTCDLGQKSRWRRWIMAALGRYCECYVIYVPGTAEARVWGQRDRVPLAWDLYERVLGHILRESQRHVEATAERVWPRRLSSGQSRRVRNAFCESAAVGLVRKVDGLLATEARADVEAFALVLNSQARAEAHAKSKVNIKAAGTIRYRHCDDGFAAGQSTSLAPSVEGTTRRTRRLLS